MKNYWYCDVPKGDPSIPQVGLCDEISKGSNTHDPAVFMSIIKNDPVRFWMIFEKGEMNCYLSLDNTGPYNVCLQPSKLPLTSTLYDIASQKRTHVLTDKFGNQQYN